MLTNFENIKIKISEDYEILLDDLQVGFVNPSSIWRKVDGKTIVQGPNGFKAIDCTTGFNAIRDMVSVGAVILGMPSEIVETKHIINDPTVSRTAVYLLSCSKNLKFFCGAMSAASNSHVAVVGCGGIGSSSAYLLAGAGVGELSLIDSDVIEFSNFNRQPFWSLSTLGKKKTSVLRDELLARFPDIKINCHDIDVRDLMSKNSTFKNIDLAVVTVDSPFHINIIFCQFLRENKIRFVGGGYNHAKIIIYDDIDFSFDQGGSKWEPLANRFISPSFGPSNFEIAGLVSNKALKYIWGVEDEGDLGIGQYADSRIFPRSFEIGK